MASDERLALTSLCIEWVQLSAERAHLPVEKQELLDRIRRQAEVRGPILPLLEQLLGASQIEALRSLGSGLPGVGPGRADEEQFTCPDDACDRVVVPEPGGAVPRCSVTNLSMRRA